MIIKIERLGKSGKCGKSAYKNNGSCRDYVNYLCKEDKEKYLGMEFFFNHEKEDFTPGEVIKAIDRNHGQIPKSAGKFFSIIIAPEDKEVLHLGGDKKKLKEYALKVMDIYAQNFNSLNGKNKELKGTDLTWFCKLEDYRYYKGWEPEVKQGIAKGKQRKPGAHQVHIHIIVARKDRQNRYKLSPVTNYKKVFHIEGFKLKAGYAFDSMFNYRGAVRHLEAHMEKRYGNRQAIEKYAGYKPGPIRDHEPMQSSEPMRNQELSREHKKYRDWDRAADFGLGLSL